VTDLILQRVAEAFQGSSFITPSFQHKLSRHLYSRCPCANPTASDLGLVSERCLSDTPPSNVLSIMQPVSEINSVRAPSTSTYPPPCRTRMQLKSFHGPEYSRSDVQ
jgi:hypothetical protein